MIHTVIVWHLPSGCDDLLATHNRKPFNQRTQNAHKHERSYDHD